MGAARAWERERLIFTGLLNSHVLGTCESGDGSPGHQLGTLYLHLSKSCFLPSADGGTEPDSSAPVRKDVFHHQRGKVAFYVCSPFLLPFLPPFSF